MRGFEVGKATVLLLQALFADKETGEMPLWVITAVLIIAAVFHVISLPS